MTNLTYHPPTARKWVEKRYWFRVFWRPRSRDGACVPLIHIAVATGENVKFLSELCKSHGIPIDLQFQRSKYQDGVVLINNIPKILLQLGWNDWDISEAVTDFDAENAQLSNGGEPRPSRVKARPSNEIDLANDDDHSIIILCNTDGEQNDDDDDDDGDEGYHLSPGLPSKRRGNEAASYAKLTPPWPVCDYWIKVDRRRGRVSLSSIAAALNLDVLFVMETYCAYLDRLGVPFEKYQSVPYGFIHVVNLPKLFDLLNLGWTSEEVTKAFACFAVENLHAQNLGARRVGQRKFTPSKKRVLAEEEPLGLPPRLQDFKRFAHSDDQEKEVDEASWIAEFEQDLDNLSGPQALIAFRSLDRHAELVHEFVQARVKAQEEELRQQVIAEIRAEVRPRIRERLEAKMALNEQHHQWDFRIEQEEARRTIDQMNQ